MENSNDSSGTPVKNVSNPIRDSLLGLTAINQDLTLLDYGNILVRKDYRTITSVRLISGGCAGENVNYADLVGKGALTAAVLGDTVVSPCSRLILRTIRELSQGHSDGVLVIAQTNAELFNFGLAVERAKSNCLRVRMVSVDDNKDPFKIEGKNSCGVVLLCKIAGAMGESGKSFDEIDKFCTEAAKQTISLALKCDQDLINGESDAKRAKLMLSSHSCFCSIEQTIDLDKIQLNLEPSSSIIVLLNSHKGMNKMQELILVKQVVERFKSLEINIGRLYLGNFLSTEDSVSLTLMKSFSPEILDYLDAPCLVTGWHQVRQLLPHLTADNEIISSLTKLGKQVVTSKGPKLDDKAVDVVNTSLQFACDALISCERQLNIIDSEKSAGNVGTRLKRASEHINKRLKSKKIVTNCPYAMLKSLGVLIESSVGGTMGSIYGILFEGAAENFSNLSENVEIVSTTWLDALKAGIQALEKYCKEDENFNTMYYPIKSCANIVSEELTKGQDFMQCFSLGVSSAEQSAQETRQINHKYADAGAHAVGIWMRAVFEGVKLLCMSFE